jgi:hypothetical protein
MKWEICKKSITSQFSKLSAILISGSRTRVGATQAHRTGGRVLRLLELKSARATVRSQFVDLPHYELPRIGEAGMRWSAIIGWEVLLSGTIASILTWSFYRAGDVVPRRSKGWLSFVNQFPNKVQVWTRVLVVFGSMFLIGDVVSVLGPFTQRAYSYVLGILGIEGTQIFVSVLVVFLGCAAYLFKVRNQLAYGIVEIVFAGAGGLVAGKEITAASVATLIGAVYVVSRGLDNLADGLEKRKLITMPSPEKSLSTSP